MLNAFHLVVRMFLRELGTYTDHGGASINPQHVTACVIYPVTLVNRDENGNEVGEPENFTTLRLSLSTGESVLVEDTPHLRDYFGISRDAKAVEPKAQGFARPMGVQRNGKK